MRNYSEEFFKKQQVGSLLSAKEIVPLVLKFLKPKSVVDIGCGTGTWLSVFYNDYNVNDILGIDGAYVSKDYLLIPKEFFKELDLNE